MGTRMLHVRVEDDVKERASIALEQMGLTMSEAVRVFLHRVAADQKLPFALEVPNERTRAAMEEARVLSARFDTAADLFDDLDAARR